MDLEEIYRLAEYKGFSPDEYDEFDAGWETACRVLLGQKRYIETRRLHEHTGLHPDRENERCEA